MSLIMSGIDEAKLVNILINDVPSEAAGFEYRQGGTGLRPSRRGVMR